MLPCIDLHALEPCSLAIPALVRTEQKELVRTELNSFYFYYWGGELNLQISRAGFSVAKDQAMKL